MTDVVLVGPPEDNGGVGRYTSQLADGLDPHEVRRIAVGNHPLAHLRLAVGAATSGCRNVHVQYVYRLFGSAGVLSYLFLPVLWLLSRATGTRILVTLHEVWDRETVANPVEWLYVRVTHLLVRATTDRLVLLSDAALESFAESAPAGDVTVVPHGVDVEGTRPVEDPKSTFGFDESTFLVTQHGYVNPRKGYDTFLEIARRLPDRQFLLAGGPRTGEFEDLYAEIRRTAPDNVTITGTLGAEAFHAAFQASDLAVLPYEEIFQSGIFNWCAAYGVPTVASDVPYFAGLEKSYGVPVVFSDVEGAVEAVERLCEDDDRRRDLGERMEAYAEKHTLQSVIERNRELYA